MSKIVAEMRDVLRSFTQGDVTIDVLRGVDLAIRRGGTRRAARAVGDGQVDLLQALGLLEGGFGGSILIDGEEMRDAGPDRATVVRREKLGFRLSVPPPAARFRRAGKCRAAAADFRRRTGRGRAERATSLLLHAWGWASDWNTARRSFPAVSSSAWRWRARWRTSPRLVLADEPTGNLDEHTADVVLGEFMALVRGQGSAALVATHNERLAAKMDRVVRLHDGMLEER
jgi:lipoprotein-releasing system ATP-binding protein